MCARKVRGLVPLPTACELIICPVHFPCQHFARDDGDILGTVTMQRKSISKQTARYTQCYGPGAVLFRLGYSEKLAFPDVQVHCYCFDPPIPLQGVSRRHSPKHHGSQHRPYPNLRATLCPSEQRLQQPCLLSGRTLATLSLCQPNTLLDPRV